MLEWYGRGGRTVVLVQNFDLLRQPQPGQRHVEQDAFIFRGLLGLGLMHTIGSVLTIPCYAYHRRPHRLHAPKPGRIDGGKLWPVADRIAARIPNGNPAAPRLARLAHQRLLPPFVGALVDAGFG